MAKRSGQALEFAALRPEELEDIVTFLTNVFQVSSEAPFVDQKLLMWKYFGNHPGWHGSRSYILRQGSRIVAHGCVYPVSFLTPRGEVPSLRVIDWGADRSVPGAGFILFRKLVALVGTAIAVGGSPQTQQMLPQMGFKRRGSLEICSRIIRPLRQFVTRTHHDWKSPLRLARNVAWALRPVERHSAGWSVEAVPIFDARVEPLLARRAKSLVLTGIRNVEMLNYLLQCPGARTSAFLLTHERNPLGYFILSHVKGQTRIADLWVDSPSAQEWAAGYALAVKAAAEDPLCCEVMSVAPFESIRPALTNNGFIPRRRDSIFVLDPAGVLTSSSPGLTLLDGDEWFLSDSGSPYLT